MPEQKNEILTIREFARRAGVAESTIRNHIKWGWLKTCVRETFGVDAGQLEEYTKKV